MMRYKFSFWIIFIVSILLFYTPIQVDERVGLGFDKLVHLFMFASLLYLWNKAYAGRLLGGVIWLMVYAVTTEFIQGNFIPHRSFDGLDIIADFLGLIFAVTAIFFLTRRSLGKT